MSLSPSAADQPSRTWPQFGIGALLWLTTLIAITVAYLRWFDARESLLALLAIGLGLVTGALAGTLARRRRDAMYWSVIGAFSAFLCASQQDLYHGSFLYGWMLVGAVAGALGGVTAPGRPFAGMAIGGVSGGIILGGFALAFAEMAGEALIEVLCAAIAGALLAAVIEMVYWVERRNGTPRYATATGLVLAVVVGNVVARWFIPNPPW